MIIVFLVSNGIVRAHGGTLNVYSGGVGCGSTFSVEFPLEAITQRDSPMGSPSRSETKTLTAFFCAYTCVLNRTSTLLSLLCASMRGTNKIVAANCDGNYARAHGRDQSTYRKSVRNHSVSIRSSVTVWDGSTRQRVDMKTEGASVRKMQFKHQDSSVAPITEFPEGADSDNVTLNALVQCFDSNQKLLDNNISTSVDEDVVRISGLDMEPYSKNPIKYLDLSDVKDDTKCTSQQIVPDEIAVSLKSSPSLSSSNLQTSKHHHTRYHQTNDENEEKKHSIYYYKSSNNSLRYANRLKVLIVDDVELNR